MRCLALVLTVSALSACAGASSPATEPAAPSRVSRGAPPPLAPTTGATATAAQAPPLPSPPDPVALIHYELGSDVPIAREDPFVLASGSFTLPALAQIAKLVHGATDALYTGRFATHMEHPVAVYLFDSSRPYERFCKERLHEECISPFGFYRPDARAIVMNAGPGIGTLTHEIVHPLLEADFPRAPVWIDEGIASLFEAPLLPRPGEIHGAKNWRLPRLRAALASPKERDSAHLEALFGMPDDVFRDGDERLHYAMARYACKWLDDRGKLWEFYRAWRDGYEGDPSGAIAFRAATGMSPAEANEAWTSWVRRL